MRINPFRKLLRPFTLHKIDIYILSEVIGPFFGGLAFFTFVFLMFQALRLVEFFIVHGIPGGIILKMGALLALSFLPTALPIAFLIAVLVAFGRISSDSELVAMKSCGLGILRLTLPVVFLSFGVVILSLALNLEWVPLGLQNYRRTVVKVGNTQVVSSIQEGTFTSDFFDLLIFVDKVDRETSKLKHVFIYDESEPKTPLTIVGREGILLPVKSDSELGASSVLQLYNGNIHSSNALEETYQLINYKQYRHYLNITEGQDNTVGLKPSMMTYQHLLEKITEQTPSNSNMLRELKTELWQRIAVAFSALIFVFLGVGYGTIRTRSVKSGATLIAFLVILVYWGIQVGMTSLAHQGTIPPYIAMQIPNFVIMIAAIHAFKKATW